MSHKKIIAELEQKEQYLIAELKLVRDSLTSLKALDSLSSPHKVAIPKTGRKERTSIPFSKLIIKILKEVQRPQTYTEILDKVKNLYHDIPINPENKLRLLRSLTYLEQKQEVIPVSDAQGAFASNIKKRIFALPEWLDDKGNLIKPYNKK